MGAVSLQSKEDGKLHPIEYYSSTLNEAEQNYDIYDLELLVLRSILFVSVWLLISVNLSLC